MISNQDSSISDKTFKKLGEATPEFGRVYKGIVDSVSHATGMCSVRIANSSTILENCRWAVGLIFAPLLGYRVNQMPTHGTHVFVLYGHPSFIIQVATADNPDPESGSSSSLTGQETRPESGMYGKEGYTAFGPMNADLLEGEFEIANAMGVASVFLSNLIAMKAGDRAVVEAHLLNDMVRIISERFDHHSAFKSLTEYCDGHVSAEENAFSRYSESEQSFIGQPAANVKGNNVSLTDARDYVDIKTSRYRKYSGWVGKFIHEFIRDPAITYGQINSANSARYYGQDGTILYRSLAEIAFEKVVRISVPIRNRRPEDPKGDKPSDLDDLKIAWKTKNPRHTSYQLREYARYLSTTESMSRFHGCKEDFEVPVESNTRPPSATNNDPDSAGNAYHLRYSCIRIMRDGCIVITDGWGATYYSGYGNTQISAPGDMELSAGGSIVMSSKDLFVRANRHVEVATDTGNLTVDSNKAVKVLAREKEVWIKSDYSDPEGTTPAVLIDASAGSVVVSGERSATVISDEGQVVIKGVEIFVAAKDFIKVTAVDIYCELKETLRFKVQKFLVGAANFFQINKSLHVNDGEAIFAVPVDANEGLRSFDLIAGIYDYTTFDSASEVEQLELDDLEILDIINFNPTDDVTLKINNSLFQLDKEGKAPSTSTTNYRPHAQFMSSLPGEDWNLVTPRRSGSRTSSSVLPWPGVNAEELFPMDQLDLNKPSTVPFYDKATDLTKGPVIRKLKQ